MRVPACQKWALVRENSKSPARCLGRMIKLLKIENNSSKWFVVCVNLICMRAGRRILLLSCDPSLPEKVADGLTRWGPRLLRPSYLGVCELCVMSKGRILEMEGPLSLSRPTVCGELVTVRDDVCGRHYVSDPSDDALPLRSP